MTEKTLEQIFCITLKENVKNFPSEMDKLFYRNKLNISDDIQIAVFDTNGNWITEF